MRTTRLILAGLGALAVTSAPALAGTTSSVSMGGTAATLCTAGSGGSLSFGTLINSTNGTTSVQTGNPSFTDSSAFCNQANTTLKVQRTDLVATGVATSSGFTNTLLITSATVKSAQNGTGVTDSTSTGSGTSGGTTSTGAFGAFTNLIISALAGAGSGGNDLVASNSYSGSITITIVPTS